jgi:UTP--glucose-1-phosphate uridylyltransferase
VDLDMGDALDRALRRMREDGARPIELEAFARRFAQLADPAAGLLPGAALEPVGDLPRLDDLPHPAPDATAALLDGVALIKLNGGLGTSMGLRSPRSLLEVKPGRTFLDIIARQAAALRERHGARLPLVLMDNAATRGPSLEALARRGPPHADVPADFLQGREPRLWPDSLAPVTWPADPELEWCPPGHGELYVALDASGMLAALLDAGYRWGFVSNADNLGAVPDARVAALAQEHGTPFVMEVVRGTAADRKGGHIARRDGRLVLRETAQVPAGDTSFGDVARWRFYNTNNLWVDLPALRRLLERDEAGPDLPLIVTRRPVDPLDLESPDVVQLETAMGAALGAIDGAAALEVARSRFAPVKTTDDLLVVRSDAYALADDGRMVPAFDGDPPAVALDRAHYRTVAQLEARFPSGPPSLRRCRRLELRGAVTFGAGVVVEGDVVLGGPATIPDGTVLRG